MKSAIKIAALLLLAPALAHATVGQLDVQSIAQSASSTTSEWSGMGLLQKVFGGIVTNPLNPSSTGSASSILGEVFAVLNASLLAIGFIWMMYTISSGVAQTAHEGELMGRRYSTLWTPIRMISGTVGIVPVFHGWSLAQLIMLWFSMLSVGIANMGWDQGADFLANGGDLVVQAVPSQNIQQVAEAVFDASLCVEANNAGISISNALRANDPLSQPETGQYGGQATQDGSGYQWGFLQANGGYGDASCGSVQFPSAGSALSAGSGGFLGSAGNFIGGQAVSVENATRNAAMAAFQNLAQSADQAANDLVHSIVAAQAANLSTLGLAQAIPPDYKASVIESLALAYQHDLESKIAAVSSGSNSGAYAAEQMVQNVKTTSQSIGFTSAGAWFTTLAGLSTAMEHALTASVSVRSSPSQLASFQYGSYVYGPALRDKAFIDAANAGASSQAPGSTTANMAPADPASSWIDGKIHDVAMKMCPTGTAMNNAAGVSSPGQCVVEGLVGSTTLGANSSALIRMKDAGDYLMGAAEIGVTAFGALEGYKSGLTGKVEEDAASLFTGGASDAVIGAGMVWGKILKEVFLAIMLAGVSMSIYLPLVPFIVWVAACATWLAVVVEAVVGAPLWAFAHMDAEGEGMGQRTAHGYLFTLNVLFRPFLMIVGLILAAVLIQVIGGLFLYLFPMAMSSVQVDSVTGVFSIVGFIVVYVSGCLAIVNTGVNMINMVPNNVLSWIGGTMINNFGENMQRHTDSVGTFQGASNSVAMAIRGDLQGMKGMRQQRQAKEQDKVAREEGFKP